jgi:hypothetical protein
MNPFPSKEMLVHIENLANMEFLNPKEAIRDTHWNYGRTSLSPLLIHEPHATTKHNGPAIDWIQTT